MSTAEGVAADGLGSSWVVEVVAIEERELDSASSTSGAAFAARASPRAGGASSVVEELESPEGPWKLSNKLRAINASPSFAPVIKPSQGV